MQLLFGYLSLHQLRRSIATVRELFASCFRKHDSKRLRDRIKNIKKNFDFLFRSRDSRESEARLILNGSKFERKETKSKRVFFRKVVSKQ